MSNGNIACFGGAGTAFFVCVGENSSSIRRKVLFFTARTVYNRAYRINSTGVPFGHHRGKKVITCGLFLTFNAAAS